MGNEIAYEGEGWQRMENGDLECQHCGLGWGRNLMGDVPPVRFAIDHLWADHGEIMNRKEGETGNG